MDEECSEASGVARVAGVGGVGVATVTGLDAALAALAGGSGSGAAGLLLRQPMGQWRVCAGASGRDALLRISNTSVTRRQNPCEFSLEIGQ